MHLMLLTTHYSLLTTHYSLLTTHYSLLTTHYPLLTTHYSPQHLVPYVTVEEGRSGDGEGVGNQAVLDLG